MTVVWAAEPTTDAQPNPLRPDGLYPILVTADVLERMRPWGRRVAVAWGEPDEDGFYTPTIRYLREDVPALDDEAPGPLEPAELEEDDPAIDHESV